MKSYKIKILREAGLNPTTGHMMNEQTETLHIEAENELHAFKQSQIRSTIKFYGQVRRTFIDGSEYPDPRY